MYNNFALMYSSVFSGHLMIIKYVGINSDKKKMETRACSILANIKFKLS